MKILQNVVDLHRDLLQGAVETVQGDQNLLVQVAEVIGLRKIEMTFTERSLIDVQNLLEVMGTKMRGDQDLPDQTVGVINTGMKDVQDLDLVIEMINTEIKGAQDPVAEMTDTRKIDVQDHLVILLHDGAHAHHHTRETGKAVDMMKGGDLVLQNHIDPGETVILEIIPSPISALESLGLVTTLLKETSTVYSQNMAI